MRKTNNRISLNTLDEYAKTISYAQACRLYEAKTTKKFNKALFESVSDRNIIPYEFWIDNFTIDEYELPSVYNIKQMIKSKILSKELEIVITEDGIAMRTSNPDVYEELITVINEVLPELPNDVINSNIDSNYLNEN